MKLVGYKLTGQDNDTVMFEEEDAVPRCSRCGYRLNFEPHNPAYRLRSKRDDISATYDGQLVVSTAFKNVCLEAGYRGPAFLGFDTDPNHHHLIVTPQIAFDAQRRETRFENLCSVCGNYESIVGTRPCYLLVDEPLPDDFFRTDLMFASGNEKHPLVVVGIETKARLLAAGLKGLEFSPAYGRD